MKSEISEIRDIPLEDLDIGKGQVRVKDVSKDLDDLVQSIRVMGLLEPIVVCPSEKAGKFEILTGQRRFLAHKELKKKTIKAVVLATRVDEKTAKAISLTENLIRRDIGTKELIDACCYLYKSYGDLKIVAEETGLSTAKVAQYVKYDRLVKPLKKLVDDGDLDIKAALRAQDAATTDGDISTEDAITFAKEMAGMSGVQQERVVKARKQDPDAKAEKIIKAAKSSEKVTQIVVTLGANIHRALQDYAKEESVSQDEAAATLLEESLTAKGFES
jgi:ParB family chromosome partitioning protein